MASPVIFKRTKAKHSTRSRQLSPSADEGGAPSTAAGLGAGVSTNENSPGADASEDSPSAILASKLRTKRAKQRPKSALSFGGEVDEEGAGEVFQVKKSSLSRKLTLGKSVHALPTHLDQASITPRNYDGPKYDQAYLSELKASTPSARPRPAADESGDGDVSMSIDPDDISMHAQVVETVNIVASDTSIPSESSIKVAKEKRERHRTTGREEDFISLSVTKRSEEYQGPHPESRLVREDDELGEGDDEYAEYTSAQERIALGKKARKLEDSKRRDALKEMIAEAEEEDEETIQWEQEQLRRGGHRASEARTDEPVKLIYKAAPIPTPTPVPTLGPALARLADSLAKLSLSHASATTALGAVAQEHLEVDAREQELREMVEKAEAKRGWFNAFKDWVEGVAGFLDEKFPKLEKLEEEHLSLLKERLDMIAQRRQIDDEDDLTTFLGEAKSPSRKTETDDLGQTISKPSPASLRRERRAARLARRARRRSTRAEGEGYSTDSSLAPSDLDAFRTALADLAERKKSVLADVRAAEFRDPSKSTWWGQWRERYVDSYVGAWGGLGLVGAWEFWVRLEIVGWNPIEDTKSMDGFRWYRNLYDYSRQKKGDDEGEGELGPEGDLVSAMISTAIIPRLCKLTEVGALDVYSEKHVRRVIDLAEEVEASVESGSAKFQMLMKSIHATFERAVVDTESLMDRFSGSKAPAFDPESIPARTRFLARRVKLLKNIVRWRKYSGERFGTGRLATRLVEGCVVDIARGGWDVGGEETLKTVARILPVDIMPATVMQTLEMT